MRRPTDYRAPARFRAGASSRWRRRRRGATSTGIVGTMCVTGALAATAFVARPAWLHASAEPVPDVVPARVEAHRDLMDLLGSFLSRSHAVLAVHARGRTPYLEIVVWLEDATNLGHPDPGEIAVISHSEVLETIVYHALDPEADADPDASATIPGAPSPDFCRAWRERTDVTRRLLATGVTRVQVEPTGRRDDRARLRISLTWGAQSTDGADKGSMLLDVIMDAPDRL
ncbi:MAG: hypothetical protein GY715_15435 [Planctomycetes bacterium]|nr:hypothetical protein [Planctomycetota bacterium]